MYLFSDVGNDQPSSVLQLLRRGPLRRDPWVRFFEPSERTQNSPFLCSFTHPVQDHYLDEILPSLSGYQPSAKPAKKATQAQLDRMRESFISRGVSNERTLMALESLTRSERIDYNLVGATVAYCLNRSQGTPGGVLVFMPGVMECGCSLCFSFARGGLTRLDSEGSSKLSKLFARPHRRRSASRSSPFTRICLRKSSLRSSVLSSRATARSSLPPTSPRLPCECSPLNLGCWISLTSLQHH